MDQFAYKDPGKLKLSAQSAGWDMRGSSVKVHLLAGGVRPCMVYLMDHCNLALWKNRGNGTQPERSS